jgi:hypothetical protein
LTTVGLREVDLGAGMVHLSDQFIEDLADQAAVEEGRREFAAWLSGRQRPRS